jgi:hypothetical protein
MKKELQSPHSFPTGYCRSENNICTPAIEGTQNEHPPHLLDRQFKPLALA